jgi:hypothetical protein
VGGWVGRKERGKEGGHGCKVVVTSGRVKKRYRDRERQRQRETETERDRERQRQRETETQKETERMCVLGSRSCRIMLSRKSGSTSWDDSLQTTKVSRKMRREEAKSADREKV